MDIEKLKSANKLSESIAKKYDCTIIPTALEYPIKKNGRLVSRVKIDLRTARVEEADAFVKAGYNHILVEKKSGK